MNKTQFLTLSGALLASTALSSVAGAGTIGVFTGPDTGAVFGTDPVEVANTSFPTDDSDANEIVIGSAANTQTNFGILYDNQFSGTTSWTTEFTITGARFITSGLTEDNVKIILGTGPAASTIATAICTDVTSLVNMIVVNDCTVNQTTAAAYGLALTGVTFNNASGLASAGASVSLSARVYNPDNPSQVYETASSAAIITSVEPVDISVDAGTDAIADATTTPVAFTSLSTGNDGGDFTVALATVTFSATDALSADLGTTQTVDDVFVTATIVVSSTLLSSSAVDSIRLDSAGTNYYDVTPAAVSGNQITFALDNATHIGAASQFATFTVRVLLNGTFAIPAAAAGTVTVDALLDEQAASASGTTAAVDQGGFRAEVNTFNSSGNGPFGSYLRIHNNGQVAGAVTITIRNDDHADGSVLGSAFTTAAIQPNTTMQLSAADMEGTDTVGGKLPSGGANVPVASRVGSYTVSVTGPIIGYVQHILFDGESVADLSGYRNSGATNNP